MSQSHGFLKAAVIGSQVHNCTRKLCKHKSGELFRALRRLLGQPGGHTKKDLRNKQLSYATRPRKLWHRHNMLPIIRNYYKSNCMINVMYCLTRERTIAWKNQLFWKFLKYVSKVCHMTNILQAWEWVSPTTQIAFDSLNSFPEANTHAFNWIQKIPQQTSTGFQIGFPQKHPVAGCCWQDVWIMHKKLNSKWGVYVKVNIFRVNHHAPSQQDHVPDVWVESPLSKNSKRLIRSWYSNLGFVRWEGKRNSAVGLFFG